MARVQLGDGRVVSLQRKEGESDRDLIKRAATEGKPVEGKPIELSAGTLLKEGVKRRAGDIGAMIAGTLIPGSGALGFGSRVLGSEVVQEAGDALTGQKITPGFGAVSQAVGEGAGAVMKPLLSGKPYQAFAKRTAKALADQLKELVPAWEKLPSDAKGLYEMVHGTGQRLLSQDFQQAITGVKNQIRPDHSVEVRTWIEDPNTGVRTMVGKIRNTHALIDELPTLRQGSQPEYREALRALERDLPTGVSPELDAARAAYKHGSGWIEFGEKGKFLHGEKYDPAAAQAALDTHGKVALLGRGMDKIRETVRGPGRQPIETTVLTPWSKRIAGTEVAQPVLGHGLSGLAGSAALPSEVYRNVPMTPAMELAGRAGKAAAGEVVREGARDLGVKEKLPGVQLTPLELADARRMMGGS